MTEFTTEKKTDAAPKRDRAGDQVNQIFKSVFPVQVSGVFSGSGTVTGSGFFSGSGTVTGSGFFSGSGNCYFTALPAGAKVLVQRDGSRAPLEGILTGDEESRNAFLRGIMGFSYEGRDADGNDVNITLFANSMTDRGHQRDEYAFISNAILSAFLTETSYVTAAE